MSKFPSYFSNNLEFKIKNKSDFCSDRTKLINILPAMLVGVLLVIMGIYEWFNGFENSNFEIIPLKDASPYKPLIAAGFFDLVFVLVGAIIILTSFLRLFRYNKYIITDDKMKIIHRRVFHGKKVYVEDMKNYLGVRFRVEFLQKGLMAKNRYIIELYHKNPEKNVPLYISTSEENVRRKWKDYAKELKLPAIVVTDEGAKATEVKDLNKSIQALYKAGLIADNYDDYEKLPKVFAFVRKKDKIVIKIKKTVWDVYSIMAWVAVVLMTAFTGVMLGSVNNLPKEQASGIWILAGVCLTVVLVMVQLLLRKEKLVIKRNKIVHTHKYMLFSTKHNQIKKKDIEAVEVTKNPLTERYYVAIIAENNTIAFGAKMKAKDLRWMKRFLIHEIIK